MMNDPHVQSLEYKLVSLEPNDRFAEGAPEVKAQLGSFRGELRDSLLNMWPHEHYADEASARADAEPLLRAWEAHSELHRQGTIEFQFERASVIDRAPTPGVLSPATASVRMTLLPATLIAVRPVYPSPAPTGFGESQRLRGLRVRLRGVLAGREKLLPGAYAIQSRLETVFGPGRVPTATALRVDPLVLKKLGELGAINDPEGWRKGAGPSRSLTLKEADWIGETLRMLVLRAYEIDSGMRGCPLLELTNLPAL